MSGQLNPRSKSPHQQRVEEFMRRAGQTVPNRPAVPTEEVRLLRAKLIFEEAVRELITEGLAVDVCVDRTGPSGWDSIKFVVAPDRQPNLAKIADGCADTIVVTTGTLSACGIADESVQQAVDESNLAKFSTPACPVCGSAMSLVSVKDPDQQVWQCSKYLDEHPHLPANAGGYKSDGTDGNSVGKWVKPKDWKAPDFELLLRRQVITTALPYGKAVSMYRNGYNP